jgi:UDP-glucose 4-epimerase
MYLRAYAEMYRLAPICLALADVYGPRQNPHGAGGVIAALGGAMITGLPYTVYRDGTAAHDYVYIDDVVDAFVRAGCAPIDITGTYNIGTGRHTTVTEVRELIAAVLDGASAATFALDSGEYSSASALNATKAERELGWKPTVDLAEGIQRTIRWLCATLEPEPLTPDDVIWSVDAFVRTPTNDLSLDRHPMIARYSNLPASQQRPTCSTPKARAAHADRRST